MEIEGVCPCEGGSKKSMERISILVVDDDTACLAAVASILKKFKYKVVTVKHADDALCALRIKRGGFDLVISEAHMPGMSGFELQQAIAQEFKNLPVVLMSDDPDKGVALKWLENGAVLFIHKPVCPDDVRDLWQFAAMKKPSRVMKKKSPINKGSNAKKERMMWTHSLHARFLEAIRIIGLDRAAPRKILEVMNVPGLTREHVASHLQRYRIYLRKVSNPSYLKKSVNLLTRPKTLGSVLPPLTLNEFPYQKLNFGSPLMSTYNNSSIPPSMISPSDYVDFNLKCLTGAVIKSFDGNMSNPRDDPFMDGNNINCAEDQLSDFFNNYGVTVQLNSNPHLHGANVWNAGGLNREEAYNLMLDMYSLDSLSTPQLLDEGDFHTSFPDQVSILNQAQSHAQQDEGATFMTSNIYADTSRRDQNIFSSFDPAPNQQQYMVEPQDQLVSNSYAQLMNDAMLLPPPPKEHDEGDEFIDSLNTSTPWWNLTT